MNFDFDLGLGSNRSKSLNEQKNKPNFSSSSYSYQSKTAPSWQPGKPSWTHQPAPSYTGVTRSELGGPTSMVGDIFGKSWNFTAPAATGRSPSIGVVNKNPNLFGDLVSSALGQNKGSSNAPLKSAAAAPKTSFSMGGMSDSLPQMSNDNVGKNWGSSQSFGGFGGGSNTSNGVYGSNSVNKSSSIGGGSMPDVSGGGGVRMSSNKDPFGSLVDFSSKPMSGGGGGLNWSSKASASSTYSEDFSFGDFQNASKSNTSTFSSGNSKLWGSSSGSVPKMDSFSTQNAATVQSSGDDSFDMFIPPSVLAGGGGGAAATADSIAGGLSGGDDWGLDSSFGGGHDGGNTTEIEGLPPPPAGVSASSAKAKGLDNYKQGQFADAIKWLSWAVVLQEKNGDKAGSTEVLTCRSSCYKEVGEYKKAVADCTKILENDKANVAVLVQRALLYESMEKYRLGADDLRSVMKLDPGNRVARSTIHRLNKMAD